jgi:hypothetical protein
MVTKHGPNSSLVPLALTFLLCAVPVIPAAEPARDATNVSGFRGPERNGIYPAKNLLQSWPAEGPEPVSQFRVASGWTAPSFAGGLIYFAGKTGEEGRLQAFTFDGKEVLNVVYGPEKARELPRATPAVGEGRIYYQSNLGILYCLDAKTGAKQWSADLNEYGDTSTLTGGVSASPLIHGGLVIVAARGKTNDDPSFVAFDGRTGKLAWKGNLGPCPEPGKTWSNFHQSPVLVDTGKNRLAVCGYFRCVGAVNADTGEKAWTLLLNDPAQKGLSRDKIQPVFNEGYLFLAGTAMQELQPDGSFKTLWEGLVKVPEYNVSYSHTIIRNGLLIAFNPPAVKCLEAKTGKLLGSVPCGAQGSIVMADDMVILFDNRPRVALISASRDGLKEVSSFKPPFGGGRNDNFCHPAVADGRLILRKFERVAVYDLRSGK